MRCLASSTCLLLQIIAMLAMFVFVFAKESFCVHLDEKVDLFPQMANCIGNTFSFSSANSVIDLSELDQATADVILFNKKSNGEPDPASPKSFAGHVKIVGSKLEKLTLSVAVGSGATKQPNVEIISNTKLESLKIRSDGISFNLILKGNKRLSKASIKAVKQVSQIKVPPSVIQEYQECFFNNTAVKHISELIGCKGVYGDLIIDKDTGIPDPMPFIRIRKIRKGCLQIENSKLKNINFLEDLLDGKSKAECTGQSHIKGNAELCMTSEDRLKWSKVFTLNYAGKCPDRCTVKFAQDNPDKTQAPCDVVVGNVQIDGKSVTLAQLDHWDRVKVLEGTLNVDGTNLEDIVIFKNLEKIINPSTEKIALTVVNNQRMTKFDLPKLTSITMSPGAWSDPIFVDLNNPKFEFSLAEGDKWKRVVGRDNLLIPVELPTTTTAAPTTPATTTMSSKQIDDLNKKIADENEKTKRNEKLAIGGICAGSAVVVVILGIVGTVFWLRWKNKTGKVEKEDDDLKSMQMAPAMKTSEEKEKLETARELEKKDEDKKEETSEDLTMALAVQAEQHQLNSTDKRIVKGDSESDRQEIARAEMALEAEEISFKTADVIQDIDAPEMDLEKARSLLKRKLATMKYKGRPYRHIYKYKILFFNPKTLNLAPVPYFKKYDRITVFKYLVTHCSEFFLTNAHLLPDVIADCSGPYYTPNGTLLAEVDGPVYVIGDLHEALHVLQTILNLDLFGEGKKHEIHPMFRHKYIFLGDYLDRGYHGLEVFFLLCIAVRLFPELFTVLRGNHDGRVPTHTPFENKSVMNTYGDRLKEKKAKVVNPYHFAECMITDIHTKVTPYLPMAAIINGQTFAAHGGLTLGMAIGKKSIKEIFKEIPIPYYDVKTYKQEQYNRYFPDHKEYIDEKFKTKKEDQYTKRYDKMLQDLKVWEKKGKEEYKEKKKENPNMPVDPSFESQYPGLNSVMWSDPTPAVASAGNNRLLGCTYTTELVLKMVENNKKTENNKAIVDIIRAHQVLGIAHSCDDRVTTVFSNCDNVQNLKCKPENMGCPIDLMNCASILRINEDGSRTIILMSITGEKKAKQALVNPNKKIRRTTLGLKKNNGGRGNAKSKSSTKEEKSSHSKSSAKQEQPKKSKGSKEKSSHRKEKSSHRKEKSSDSKQKSSSHSKENSSQSKSSKQEKKKNSQVN